MFKHAIGQFHVSSDIDYNCNKICSMITAAKEKKAKLIQFCECALSGYLPIIPNYKSKITKDRVDNAIKKISEHSKKNSIWVCFGTAYFIDEDTKYCSIICIDNFGEIQGRYDKRYLTDLESNYFKKGDSAFTFKIENYTFGCLLCYETHLFELYREYKKSNVNCILLSAYTFFENISDIKADVITELEAFPPELSASYNRFYISSANHCNDWHSSFFYPDGNIKQIANNIECVEVFELELKTFQKTLDRDRNILL